LDYSRHLIVNENKFMAIKIIYFVHGTTADNEKEISSGWYDVGLSELGIQQSIDLWDQIKDKKIDIVFCSDLKRAVNSTELTFKDKVKIVIDERLRECNYGEYNAKPSRVVEPLQEKNIEERFPEGESYEDVKKRISEFLSDLKEEYEGKTIAIVAHKAPQLALDVLLKDKTWEQAFTEDWRKRKEWQPGWHYVLE
jgi:broad specificity phosphatase PhoE